MKKDCMSVPSNYDPITLNHWLWFKYLCNECTFTEFQRIFENIIKRARPHFMQIKPHGPLGDRKCDGLLLADTTIFQVYAPDELRLNDLKDKIDEDLDFAAEYWKEFLQAWYFVYNVRRGVAADVAMLLLEKKAKYPHLEIDHLSNDALWEIARNELSLQQRVEVLGAPAGYENLFLFPNATPEDVRELLHNSWSVIIQDTMSPVNLRDITPALEPELPFGAPFYIRPPLASLIWDEAAEFQRIKVKELLEKTWEIQPRYALFSFAQIPLATHLGFLLSDRVVVRYSQYDRDNRTWKWPDADKAVVDVDFAVTGLPEKPLQNQCEITIRVSLSAQVMPHQTDPVAPDSAVMIDISVARPDVTWLQSPQQVVEFAKVFRGVLARIRSHVPHCSGIHLFYAGPTACAVAIGQQINPRMCPPVTLYQFSVQTDPQYQYAFTLTEANSLKSH